MLNFSGFRAFAALFLLTAPWIFANAQDVPPELSKIAKDAALDLVKERLPSAIEIYYLDNTDSDEQSLAIRYDWNSNNSWADDFGESGMDFSGSRANLFIRGNYVFKDIVNPSELSEIGASWTKRWFKIRSDYVLEPAESQAVQICLLENSENFDVDVERCRQIVGVQKTKLSYWYVDLDFHGKVEGDQSFDQRNYVFGLETNLSRKFGEQKLFLNPILTLGIEQVDPKGNVAREAVMASDDIYTRAYGRFGFTGVVGKINEQNIKLNVYTRYFQEISPEQAIKDAGLDTFHYTVVALQVPAAIFPGFSNARNSFVLSYATGELPFNQSSETTFELGFRHNLDLSGFLNSL